MMTSPLAAWEIAPPAFPPAFPPAAWEIAAWEIAPPAPPPAPPLAAWEIAAGEIAAPAPPLADWEIAAAPAAPPAAPPAPVAPVPPRACCVCARPCFGTCGYCHAAAFCSSACLKAAWPSHRPACEVPPPGLAFNYPRPPTVPGARAVRLVPPPPPRLPPMRSPVMADMV